MAKSKKKFKTIDEYTARFPKEVKQGLEKMEKSYLLKILGEGK